MLQIDNPKKRLVASIINNLGRLTYRSGEFIGLWHRFDEDPSAIEPKNILVIEVEPIGDVVMSTPVYAALRERYPHAHLAVMVGP